MLKKYLNFKKVIRSAQCCFYEAQLKQNMQKVLIKRLKSKFSWNHMLKSQALKVQSLGQGFPRLLQIFKSNGQYFIVYERPSGQCLDFFQIGIKRQLVDFFHLFNQLLNSITKLQSQIDQLCIYPEWLFIHRNQIKICHFEPYFDGECKKQQKPGTHVFMFNLKQTGGQQDDRNKFYSLKRIRNLNFNLGYLAYHLLTGKVTNWKVDQNDYESKIKQIQLNCQIRIQKQTNDQKLTSLISKLLKCTDDQQQLKNNELLDQFRTYIKRRCIEFKCCKHNQHFRIVQVSLQKIKLQKKQSKIRIEKKKKSIRPCCEKIFKDQTNPEQQQPYTKFRMIEKYQQPESNRINNKFSTEKGANSSQKNLNSKLPLTTGKSINRHKINSSCCLPSLKSDRKSSSMVKNMKFKGLSTVFKNSFQIVQTSKNSKKLLTQPF